MSAITENQSQIVSPLEPVLTGTLRGFLLFEISESIHLERLRELLGVHLSRREPAFGHSAPEYVRFQRPPVVEIIASRGFTSVGLVDVRIRYFDYGVASVDLSRPFNSSWADLVQLAQHWITSPELENSAVGLLHQALERTGSALEKPHSHWISEDYFLVQVDPFSDTSGRTTTAEQLLREAGREIAQIVRGEANPLSSSECGEVLQSSMSYYATDLLVLGWTAAFIYDNRAASEPTIDLLEYANTQLLEFRYYDDVLTKVLAGVYKRLEGRHSMWERWRMAREAQTLNTIRLDYQELVERTENAIKFLGDMFYARVYRLAAARIGVSDYRNLVSEKLATARDLYDTLINEFHQGRAFFLEAAVVVILIVEIVFLLIGKH